LRFDILDSLNMGGGSSVAKKSPVGQIAKVSESKSSPSNVLASNFDRKLTQSPQQQAAPSPKSPPKNESEDGMEAASSPVRNALNMRRSAANANGMFSEEQDRNESDFSPRSEASTGAAELFSHTAMSLGMDNDDLLFNLLYFGDGGGTNFGVALNNAQQETIALYSENNTPYKLKPASASSIAGLIDDVYSDDTGAEAECAVCKEEFEFNCEILRIPTCKHYFHQDCLIRWIKLQGWCPVCRAKIETEKVTENENKQEDCDVDDNTRHSCNHMMHHPTAVAHLAEQFCDAAGNTETDDD